VKNAKEKGCELIAAAIDIEVDAGTLKWSLP
jgi:hypothetical protein